LCKTTAAPTPHHEAVVVVFECAALMIKVKIAAWCFVKVLLFGTGV
jgi:hypothetical protein